MPEVVLRHEELPGQPYVISVAPGEYVPNDLKASGWSIDESTSPDEARQEAAETSLAAAEKADEAAKNFKPSFAPDEQPEQADVAPAETPSAPAEQVVTQSPTKSRNAATPAEPANPSSAPADDPSKEK